MWVSGRLMAWGERGGERKTWHVCNLVEKCHSLPLAGCRQGSTVGRAEEQASPETGSVPIFTDAGKSHSTLSALPQLYNGDNDSDLTSFLQNTLRSLGSEYDRSAKYYSLFVVRH